MKKKVLALALLLTLALSSCATLKLEGSMLGSLDGISRIGVTSVSYGERTLPVIPLIDAGLHNAAVSSVKEELLAAESENAEVITSAIVNGVAARTDSDAVVVDSDPALFENEESSADHAVSIIQEKELDALVVVTTRVETSGVSGFGINGANSVKLKIKIFGSDGSLISEGYYRTAAEMTKPKDVNAYRALLRSSNENIDSLLDLLLIK
ncbi:hypothetical protein [Spirochaeta isovalerica]|uniref:Lipoprotein n=1 Tax=Spirochaeta isovalerica TaxID=150 RepID=A0A841R709_9SPIO|nr:hypothetical protein [Spirochaeta isovalerica]MBB6481014.1 hypothetical protein [Spirochaeta isovalerica]